MISDELLKHLRKEHKISPLSIYLKEIVYGGNDGIVTTFAVVAGFAGAQQVNGLPAIPFFTVLLFGLANLFSDAASMGLGNFLSLRSEKDVYMGEKQKELHEIRTKPEVEIKETIELLVSKKFSQEDATKIAKIYATNESYWLEFMMKDELELPNPEQENPFLTGMSTFASFIFFGFIPLIPYVFMRQGAPLFLLSIFFTFGALILLGLLRWQVTKINILRSVGEIVLVGGISAAIAFVVGTFFRV